MGIERFLSEARKVFVNTSFCQKEPQVDAIIDSMKKIRNAEVIQKYLTLYDFGGIKALDYLNIEENLNLSCGLFVVPEYGSLSLHSHPGMWGFVKVIVGSLRVVAYDPIQKDYENLSRFDAQVVKHDIVSEKSPNILHLTPTHSNLHSIHSVDGPCVFLDLLAPPYSANRVCSYFINTTVDFSVSKLMSTPKEILELELFTIHKLLRELK
ncbi:2-aminoethanethiol dioxygenase [Thelohanellus kitauei]|uniref:2-aminoethanethiol dioxygenase n=1 Tax=Thelohanellus kitauei TaxID=669202 RepID=A0A0C2MF31_THEKT|nr:2-aminoethanethiol dioxygenase [Thelohanellus kitauei]